MISNLRGTNPLRTSLYPAEALIIRHPPVKAPRRSQPRPAGMAVLRSAPARPAEDGVGPPRGVAQLGRALRSGRRGPQFKSAHPDQARCRSSALPPGRRLPIANCGGCCYHAPPTGAVRRFFEQPRAPLDDLPAGRDAVMLHEQGPPRLSRAPALRVALASRPPDGSPPRPIDQGIPRSGNAVAVCKNFRRIGAWEESFPRKHTFCE